MKSHCIPCSACFRKFYFIIVLLLPLMARSATTNLQTQLLKFCELPPIQFSLGFNFSTFEGFKLLGDKFDEDSEIASLPQRLNNAEKEPEALAQIVLLLRKRELTNEASQAIKRVVDVYTARLAINSNDVPALIGLGKVLEEMGEEERSESLLRDAIRRAPGDWHTHSALAQFKSGQAWNIFTTETNSTKRTKVFSAEEVKRSEALLKEARRLFDDAVRVSGGDGNARYERVRFLLLETAYLPMLQKVRGENVKTNAILAMLNPEILADVRSSAASSKDYSAIATVAFLEAMTALKRADGFKAGDFEDIWKSLPEASKDVVAQAVKRLDTIAAELPALKASAALECRAILQFLLMNDPTNAVVSGKRALALNPMRGSARWTLMAINSYEEENATSILALAEERLAVANSAPWHFYAARACDRLHRDSDAEAHARAGLRLEPNNIECLLSLAALDLRRATNIVGLVKAMVSLKQVETALNTITESFNAGKPKMEAATLKSLTAHASMLLAIYQALDDKKEEALKTAQMALGYEPDNERFNELARLLK